MSGDGGIIVRNAAMQGLKDPLVHGALPPDMAKKLDAIFAADPGTWNPQQCASVGQAMKWALTNL